MEQQSGLPKSYWPADTSVDLIDTTLGGLLYRVASEVPDRIALVDGAVDAAARRRWTYAELQDKTERIAKSLLELFEPGERVAIFAPNSAEWVFLQHGLSLAGLVLVPLNPAYRKAEVTKILNDSGASGLFYVDRFRDNDIAAMVEGLRDDLPGLRETLPIADLNRLVVTANPAKSLPTIQSQQLLQLQYTSGTTGAPKGACLHHHGVINTSRFVALRAGFPDGGVWINAMPMFHIGGAGVSHIGTLASRGTFVIMEGFEPGLMLELIESERGSGGLIVPTMIIALLDHPDFARRDLSSVTTILSGASTVPAALVHRTKAAIGCNMTILFGQTELNGVVTQTRMDDSVEDQSETIGQPLPQAEVAIFDTETNEILPIGAPGEIRVRGYQNMRAYYGMEEATKATITPDGWLCTGDTGTMDDRGYLRIIGRLKDMIIRGGMNIYPREIEDVLCGHSQVAEVSVLGLPDDKWGEIVTAFIRPVDAENPPSPDELSRFCRERLSPHKSPVKWVFLDAYPTTPSGKVQKFVLRDWVKNDVLRPIDWTPPSRSPAPEGPNSNKI